MNSIEAHKKIALSMDLKQLIAALKRIKDRMDKPDGESFKPIYKIYEYEFYLEISSLNSRNYSSLVH